MEIHALIARMAPYGLDEGEATVYYHLSRLGGARAADVAHAAKRKRPDTYRLLDALVRKGFAQKTLERPTRFLALPIDQALQRWLAARREAADALAEQADELVAAWPRAHADPGPGNQRFTVYQGREQVLGLIRRMLASASEEVMLVASPGGLGSLGLAAFFESVDGAAGAQVHIRVLTKADSSRSESFASLRGVADIRHAELPSYHEMIIVDTQQIALFVSSGRKVSTQGEIQTVLWLNTPDFVMAQKALFDEVWATSLSVDEAEAAEREGRLPIETRLLRGRWQRLDRMRRMAGQAKRDLHIHAPAEEVARWAKSGFTRALAAQAKRGVQVAVWTEAPVSMPGVITHPAPRPASMVCIADDAQCLTVSGACEEPTALAYDGEWGVWSTHPDAVAAARTGLATLAVRTA